MPMILRPGVLIGTVHRLAEASLLPSGASVNQVSGTDPFKTVVHTPKPTLLKGKPLVGMLTGPQDSGSSWQLAAAASPG